MDEREGDREIHDGDPEANAFIKRFPGVPETPTGSAPEPGDSDMDIPDLLVHEEPGEPLLLHVMAPEEGAALRARGEVSEGDPVNGKEGGPDEIPEHWGDRGTSHPRHSSTS
ncbi:MAG: hypothetical protein LUP92_00570 [Methanomicrobiales archaeon]|nr:hypothetical protein [Methanomicrobiales archaeon]